MVGIDAGIDHAYDDALALAVPLRFVHMEILEMPLCVPYWVGSHSWGPDRYGRR